MSFQHANVVGENEKQHRIFYRHLQVSSIVLFRFWVLNKETDNCTENWELLHLQVLEDLRAGNIFAGHLFFTPVVFGPLGSTRKNMEKSHLSPVTK